MGAGESITIIGQDLLIIVMNVYILKRLYCMSIKGCVVRLPALVIVFGDRGPYSSMMHMHRF